MLPQLMPQLYLQKLANRMQLHCCDMPSIRHRVVLGMRPPLLRSQRTTCGSSSDCGEDMFSRTSELTFCFVLPA